MGIKLLRPTMKYAADIMEMRQELLNNDNKYSFAGCGTLKNCQSAEEWIESCDVKEYPDAMIPTSRCIAVRENDDKIVGVVDLRHHIEHPVLRDWGGHIAYTVRPSERRKGYVKEMMRQVLQKGKEMGIDKIMISCNDDNVISEKVILSNGGVYERSAKHDGVVTKIFWIDNR